MVLAPRQVLGAIVLGCVLQSQVEAAPISANAFTPLGFVAELTEAHPAVGLPIRGDAVQPVVPDDAINRERAAALEIVNSTAVELQGNATLARRFLEATSDDISRLEHHFGQPMERNVHSLFQQYRAAEPKPIAWPGGYWPVYADSLNYRWKSNEASPAEKYARAFGLDVKEFQDRVSQINGIDAWTGNRACTSDSQCRSLGDGSKCAIREGKRSGHCIPTWFGICHAWAPAAILEPEPRCDVVKNGVKFHAYDLKGLMTAVYDGAHVPVVFTGARFDGPDEPAKYDKYGRYVDAARRDLGPGFFHIAVTNIMGKFKQSFVVDVTAGAQVWNQPVRSYRIDESRILDISSASMKLFGTRKYPFNADAKKLAYTRMSFSWIVEAGEDGPLVPNRVDTYTRSAQYEYLLELDAQDNIIGGEWLHDSRYEHPDFLWFSVQRPSMDAVTKLGLSYKDVRELVDAQAPISQAPISQAPISQKPVTPATTAPAPISQKPVTPATTAPAPISQKPVTPATTAPAPISQKPVTPETTAPAPISQKPVTPATTAPAPISQKPVTPETTAPAPISQKPVTPATTAPAPISQKPVTPETTAPAPISQKPVTPATTAPAPISQKPVTPATTAPAPISQKPVTPATTAPAPISQKPPVTPATTAPAPISQKPVTPETTAPAPISQKPGGPKPTPAASTPAPVSQKPVGPKPTPAASTPAVTPAKTKKHKLCH
ncbi:hypothetical protein ATCC90586_005465 [Pythium insidiosum]|nr:hypothetical protein ATCC90586_005465 [Pythium insidiosum]